MKNRGAGHTWADIPVRAQPAECAHDYKELRTFARGGPPVLTDRSQFGTCPQLSGEASDERREEAAIRQGAAAGCGSLCKAAIKNEKLKMIFGLQPAERTLEADLRDASCGPLPPPGCGPLGPIGPNLLASISSTPTDCTLF